MGGGVNLTTPLLLRWAAGIAVWLVPSEPESALLQQLMSRHPNPTAQHSFPHFHPHVTLATIRPPTTAGRREEDETAEGTSESRLGYDDRNMIDSDIDPTILLAIREAIPLGQRALSQIRFGRVLTGDKYFLSIYIALVAPSTELAQLRATLTQALTNAVGGGGPTNPESAQRQLPAFPHLSLFYIADEEAHTRVRLLQEMEREGVVRHSADGLTVALRCGTEAQAQAGDEDAGVLEGFTGAQIWIVDCEGPVEEWKVLDKILLTTSDL